MKATEDIMIRPGNRSSKILLLAGVAIALVAGGYTFLLTLQSTLLVPVCQSRSDGSSGDWATSPIEECRRRIAVLNTGWSIALAGVCLVVLAIGLRIRNRIKARRGTQLPVAP